MSLDAFVSVTERILDARKEEMVVAESQPKRRGRPPKVIESNLPEPEVRENKKPSPFINYPKDDWDNWKTIHVNETSVIFLNWLKECQEVVDKEFGIESWILKVKNNKKYLQIIRKCLGETKIFAFVDKSTGNIHTPATEDAPFEHYCGNINDPKTRLDVITPYGIKSHWAWLPTHKDYKKTVAMEPQIDYTIKESSEESDGN